MAVGAVSEFPAAVGVFPGALAACAAALVADSKGLLAMDESAATFGTRLVSVGIVEQPGMRQAFRELLATTPGVGAFISGVILHEETFHQVRADGARLVDFLRAAGIRVGVKVDAGTQPLAHRPGERVTEGLDGLRARLQGYAAGGACFAKWRAVFVVGPLDRDVPSAACIEANAHALARYAALCQEAGLVPVVEPELLAQGSYAMSTCAELTERILRQVFAHLERQGVVLEAMILKPNMVAPGEDCTEVASPAQVAAATVRCLLRAVPAAVPGVAFLSGGQAPRLATARLNAMHLGTQGPVPWRLVFSFARALQKPVLVAWAGLPSRWRQAQQVCADRAQRNHDALLGVYDSATDPP